MSKKEKKDKQEEEFEEGEDQNGTGKEEVAFEDIIEEEGISTKSPQESIKKLKNKLKECENEKAEYLDGWLRAKSDMVNLRKRYEKEADDVRRLSERRFAEKLLPVMDSFSMAIADQDTWENLPEGWRKGMENVHSQLKRVFSDYGIYPFSPEGETFDPSSHEAVAVIDVDERESDNLITEVVQDGYTYGEEILRTAKVKVAHYPEEEIKGNESGATEDGE
ncbi:MAG: nucleotide exchange factor GrpE [Patescibacteria group bacterium]